MTADATSLRPPGSEPAFTTYRVDMLDSLSGFFPDPAARRGIYVLRFANGEQYVGLTRDVCSRFTQHRRTYADLVGLRFAPVPATVTDDELRDLERAQIRVEERRSGLRNVRDYRGHLHGVSVLDDVVPSAHQLRFLQTGVVDGDIPGRVVSDEQRRRGRRAFQRLTADPCAADAIRSGAAYLAASIPCPRATERRFWAVSAAPSTNRDGRLLCFSVNTPETFVIGTRGSDGLQGFVNVSRTVLVDEYGSLDEFADAHGGLLTLEEDAGYEACGGDAVRLVVTSADAVRDLFAGRNAVIARAAAVLNLHLMRKGPTVQGKSHNVPLADRMFDLIGSG